ncbi:MAG: class A beta-lactamase-related serine hydrolase [Candidatus Eremiobacteraeota bacterium]|nr:class A beta-lactamase-related serine hydrolase [Candidatus Eremiobacteraeota bacterium]
MKNKSEETKLPDGRYKALVYVILVIAISFALFILSKPWRQGRLIGPEEILNNATGLAGSSSSHNTTTPSRTEKKRTDEEDAHNNDPFVAKRANNESQKLEKRKIKMKQLKKELEKRIKKFPGKVGLVLYKTGTGERIEINAGEVFESASLIKIPIMLEVYNQIRDGKITEDDVVVLKNSHKVGGSGVLKNRKAGSKWKVSKLIELMIIDSDNTATDMLIELAGMEEIEKSTKEHGMKDTTLRRKIYAFEEIDRGKDNYTTPQDMFFILKELYEEEKIDGKVRAKMLIILKDQKRKDMIPKYLPNGVECAHKTGGLSGILHDCGIIYPVKGAPYILILMSKNVTNENLAKQVFANISKKVFDFM